MEGPDSGWSWIVCAACFLINMLVFATVRIGSLLYAASIKSFNFSRKEAALPFSMASALKCFCGPIVGFLADRFGIRLITLTGGILAAFGIGMCFFTHRLIPITIFWGLFFGIGFGMGTQLLPSMIKDCFDKYRATATGISFSGACVGAVILPLLVDVCLREYELNGTFLILSGVVLNCIPISLLLRKPSFILRNSFPNCTPPPFMAERAKYSNCSLQNADSCYGKGNVEDISIIVSENIKENVLSSSATNIKILCPGTVLQECTHKKSKNNSLCETNLEKTGISGNKEISTTDENIQDHTMVNDKRQNVELGDVKKANAFGSETINVHNSFRKNMILFRNPIFILIGMSRGFHAYTYISTVTVLADFAVDIEVGMSDLPYIIMSLSIGDFIGRISLGSLIDKGCMTVMQYTATFFLLHGLSIFSLAWATGFQYLVVASFVYGICGSALLISSPLLIAEYIETKLQITAMPSTEFFSGFMFLTLPKMIELFRDQIGSYVGLFCTMSAISLICSATWFIVPFFMKR